MTIKMNHLQFAIADLQLNRQETSPRLPIANCKLQIANPTAFTLTELLIVIGIMVMLFAMAVSAFRAITGNRSVAVAQNQVAAMLGQARNNAIAKQIPRGVVVYQDFSTRQINVALVGGTPTSPYALDFADNTDVLPLPAGVGVGSAVGSSAPYYFIPSPPASGVTYTPNITYTPVVVLFDGSGRFLPNVNYTFTGSIAGSTPRFLDTAMVLSGTSLAPQIALVLFDLETFQNNSNPKDWLNENATPVLINRYNGTLFKAE